MMPREILDRVLGAMPAPLRARLGRRVSPSGPGASATSLDALAASARERRAAREPAAEIEAARAARGEPATPSAEPASPWTGKPDSATTPRAAPAEGSKPDAPRSLAENLVARRKRKK